MSEDSARMRLEARVKELSEALTSCQKILAVLIDPANKGSGINNMVAWANCVAAEKKARESLRQHGERE